MPIGSNRLTIRACYMGVADERVWCWTCALPSKVLAVVALWTACANPDHAHAPVLRTFEMCLGSCGQRRAL